MTHPEGQHASGGENPSLRTMSVAIPKVELHAHLAGSIPDSVVLEMLEEDGRGKTVQSGSRASLPPRPSVTAEDILRPGDSTGLRSLSECFAVFDVIHRCVRNRARLQRATRAVLDFYSSDNCIYLELRTTPRALDDMAPVDYINCVLDTISEWHSAHPGGMRCRLLVSANRARTTTEAKEAMECAGHFASLPQSHPNAGLVVGVELSGNPEKNKFDDFEQYFAAVRTQYGNRLKISLHFAEIHNEREADAMLAFRPDRLGHAVCLSEKGTRALLDSRIPVEVCLTSNLITKSASTLSSHPIMTSLANHPFSLCCDDAGVFRTSLSHEYYIFAGEIERRGRISVETALKAVSMRAVDMSFADEDLKQILRRKISSAASVDARLQTPERK